MWVRLTSSRGLSALFATSLLFACTPSEDSTFGNILANSDGGVGNASVTITSYLPGTTSVAVKSNAAQDFLISATGSGELRYNWTYDGNPVGSNSPAFNLNAASFSVGTKVLKVTVTDSRGSTSREWTVKINGPPALSSPTPSGSTVYLRKETALNLSITATDPNSDTLTYVWKLNGSTTSSSLVPATNTAVYTPTSGEVGSQTLSVEVSDGSTSDSGTYTVSQSWTVIVNNFSQGCNDMESASTGNKACVYIGIPTIGSGANPTSSPTIGSLRPTALAYTPSGDLFIADNYYDVIFFWNRTGPAETVLGQSVPANSIKVVAGTGVNGAVAASASTYANRITLNDPEGLFYDNGDLYVSDMTNNLVRKIAANGVVTTVLGGGASNVDGASATTHVCSQPRGVLKIGDDLFVACYNSHRVKRVDLTSGLAYTFAGTGATTVPANNNDVAPNAGITNGPYGLATDGAGNVFVGEYGGCRIRLVNRSGSALSLYGGGLSIGAGMMKTIYGNPTANTCSYVAGSPITTARVHNPRHLNYKSGVLYVPNHSNHSVTALNMTAGNLVMGSVTVNSYEAARIIGNGTGGYLGDGNFASALRFNTPYEAAPHPTSSEIMVADYANLRLRLIDSDFKTQLAFGSGGTRIGTIGNVNTDVSNEKLNGPRDVVYDSYNQELFVTDSNNFRIRKIDRYGNVSQVVGIGTTGTGAEENEYPTAVTMNNPRGLALVDATSSFGGHILYADSSNHRIRFWNRSTSNVTKFGVLIEAGKIATVAGTGTAGNTTTGNALSANLNTPEGVASDGTNLYISDTSNHCVKMVDSSGDISVFSGTCGTAGNVNGAVGTARLNSPAGLTYYENGANKGIFIADRANSRIRFGRIAGTSAIAGVPVSAGHTNSVICGGTYHDDNIISTNSICNAIYGVTVANGQVCFANYNYHNVRCVDVSTGLIKTVGGALQGVDTTTPRFFPGTSFSSSDQENVTAAPNALDTDLPLDQAFLRLGFPLGVAAGPNNSLFVTEWVPSLVRKIRLP